MPKRKQFAIPAAPALGPTEAELMVRMIEATTDDPRPEGMTALQAVHHMIDEPTRTFFARAAIAALLFHVELTDAVAGARAAEGGGALTLH